MELKDKLEAFKYEKLECQANSDLKMGRNVLRMASEEGARNQSQLIAKSPIAMFIGAHSYINNGGYLRDNVFIGRFCSIGRRITIGAGMHNMYGLSTHPKIKGSNKSPFILNPDVIKHQGLTL
jgi:virginiamycin A acetyltransferase